MSVKMDDLLSQPLATYKAINTYKPTYADFVIRIGWFKTSYGVVNNFDKDSETLSIVLEGTPRLLFTMTGDEISKRVIEVKLYDIRNRRYGKWYVKQSVTKGGDIWYI